MEEITSPVSDLSWRARLAATALDYGAKKDITTWSQTGSCSPVRSPLRSVRLREEDLSKCRESDRSLATHRRASSFLEKPFTSQGSGSSLCARASERWVRWGGLRSSWLVKNSFEGWRSVNPRRSRGEAFVISRDVENYRQVRRQEPELRELKVDVDVNAIVSAVAEGLRVGPLEEMRLELQRAVSQMAQLREELREELHVSSVRMGETAREVGGLKEAILNQGFSVESSRICSSVEQRSKELRTVVERCSEDMLAALRESRGFYLSAARRPCDLDSISQVSELAGVEDRLTDLTRAINAIRVPNILPLQKALEENRSSLTYAIEESTGKLLKAGAYWKIEFDDERMSESNGKILEAIESLDFSEVAASMRRVVQVVEESRRQHAKVLESIGSMENLARSNNNDVLRAIRTLPREAIEVEHVTDAMKNVLDSSQRHIIQAVRSDLREKLDNFNFKDRHSEIIQAIHKGGDVFHEKCSIVLEQVASQVRVPDFFAAVEKCHSTTFDVLALVRKLAEDKPSKQDLLAFQDAVQRMRRDTVKDIVERLEVAVDRSPLLEAIGSFELKGHSEVLNALKQIQLDLNMEPDFSPVLLALRDLPSAADVSQAHAAINAGTRKVLSTLEAIFGPRALPQERSPSPSQAIFAPRRNPQDRSSSPGRRKFVVTMGAEPSVSPLIS